ncbi:hypothetical protein GCM10010517_15540 [Streptosporangium fragile]|uniref:Uncharacterized protein n=1 Tax=Streptosporangium fragile TaxID=46186 RepID=A0ABN3VT90_9ACTN
MWFTKPLSALPGPGPRAPATAKDPADRPTARLILETLVAPIGGSAGDVDARMTAGAAMTGTPTPVTCSCRLDRGRNPPIRTGNGGAKAVPGSRPRHRLSPEAAGVSSDGDSRASADGERPPG